MTTATYLVGDVFERLAEIPDGSVDLVMTSPPFYRLRSYLPDDHPDKPKEIGSEPTPDEYLDTMLALTAEYGRVLARHGSICVEIGDTYTGSGGAGGDYDEDGLHDGQQRFNGSARAHAGDLPPEKSLLFIPSLYAGSLAYGRNLLTGAESPAGRWRVRNLVAWVRPNPPVGALGDKFRPATSYLTIACRARDRYFDLDAVRTPAQQPSPFGDRSDRRTRIEMAADGKGDPGHHGSHPAGAPPLDWWNIPPTGYPGAHYAVYPPELCTRPILTMTPRRVCTVCGQPSRRIVEAEPSPFAAEDRVQRTVNDPGRSGPRPNGRTHMGIGRRAETVGWSDCGHGTWRPGHVLDPFAGTGTTLAVATGHGREATGIDIDPRNALLALERVGMFLTIDHGTRQETA